MPRSLINRDAFRTARPRKRESATGPLPTLSLVILASGMFLSMTSEFLPGGLLPRIGEDLGVTVTAAGQLITVFAAAVIVTTAPVAYLTRRVPRKLLMVIAFSMICVSMLGAGLAPDYQWVAAARVVGGMAHGVFWTVAGAYTSFLVHPTQLARAMAITAGGGSLAGVAGIPIGNALGQAFGWRVSFIALSAVGVVILLLILRLLPAVDHRLESGPTSRADSGAGATKVRAGRNRRASTGGIVALCVVLLVTVLGQSIFSTYIVPWLEDVVGLTPSAVPLYLAVTGVVGIAGVVISGVFGDRYPRGTVVVCIAVVIGSQALVTTLPGITLVLVLACTWTIAFAAIPPLLQARMMRTASVEQRSIAAALQTTAINVAIGGGAALGGVLAAGVGLVALPWFAVLLGVGGLLSFLLLGRDPGAPELPSGVAQRLPSEVPRRS